MLRYMSPIFVNYFEFFPRCLTIGATPHRTEKAEAATQTATETGTEIETETGIETEDEDIDTEDHRRTPPAAKETVEDEDTDRMQVALCAPEGNLDTRTLFKNNLNILLFFIIIVTSCGFCHSVGALTIALPSCGPLTEDTAKATDAWIPAEIEAATENGIPTEDRPRRTTNATSRPTCTTTGAAARGSASGTSPTGGKAAGVSTNEGGVEQGPIADPPR